MTDKEFIIQACEELKEKNSFLKRSNQKMTVEIKKLQREIAIRKKRMYLSVVP